MNRCWPAIVCVIVGLISGCDSPPTAVEPPKFNATEAATKALADYDADKNGALDKKELEKVPGILRHMELWDTDKDGKVSGNEISARVSKYISDGTGMMGFICQIQLNGQPLEGADVIFIPEPFLGPVLKSATAKSGTGGTVAPMIAKTDLPPGQTDLVGIRNGVYKVEITHPTKKIPEKYNTKTTIGVEVSTDAVGRSGLLVIPLSGS